MKIRSGFVSNSSSSSFIVNTSDTGKLALDMLKIQINEWKGYIENARNDRFNTERREHLRILEKYMKRLEKYIEDNQGKPIFIHFPSCNYDTYIMPTEDGRCYVATCNNTDWEDAINSSNSIDVEDNPTEDSVKFYKLLKESVFYSAKFNQPVIYPYYPKDFNTVCPCPHCGNKNFTFFLNLEKKVLCESCLKEYTVLDELIDFSREIA